MSVHKYNSWGRTRRPKPATGTDGGNVANAADLATLNALSDPTGTDTTNGVYQTENQRYMHLACSGSSTVSNVWVYSHAIGTWTELTTVKPSDGDLLSVAVGNNEYRIVDINGADYVAAKITGTVRMAFSTF